eukprot:3846149-Amphidinium_carterae.1
MGVPVVPMLNRADSCQQVPGFLFYWLVGRLAPHSDNYGMGLRQVACQSSSDFIKHTVTLLALHCD